MRLKNLKEYHIKVKTVKDNLEGGKTTVFSDTSALIEANIYPASGKLQAEIYGERLKYIKNMLYAGEVEPVMVDKVLHYKSTDGTIDICEGYGVCVNAAPTDPPDYKIISIKQYSHLFMELEKI